MQSTELSIQEMERCKLETDIVGFEIGIAASRDKYSATYHSYLRVDIIWKVFHNAIEIGNAWGALSL